MLVKVVTMKSIAQRRASTLAVCLSLAMSGCATFQAEEPVREGMNEMRTGKMTVPTRVMTNFSTALRCMDRQLSDFGIKDVQVMVEDLNDKTAKVPAGATDMFVSAISQMTTRSKAINFKAFGEDTKNLSAFLRTAGSKGPYQPQNLPDYVIRGSISQFDDNILKKNVDIGASLGDAKTTFLSAGFTRSATGRELGMDLSVIRTSDLGLVPGVTARNSMFLMSTGNGLDSEAGYKKLGINFLTSVSRMEGNSRALRNLIELSAIELTGKLVRVPYWRCLDIPNDTADVKAEIEDWHEGLWSNGAPEVFAFYQHHFNVLGMLPKYERGKPDEDFKFALKVYKKALGLKPSGSVNLELFQTHLTTDRAALWKTIEPLYKAELKERLMLKVTAVEPAPYKRSQIVNLSVAPNVPSHAACYLLDENNEVFRVWASDPTPRLNTDSPPAPIALPRGLLKADSKGRPMQVTCFATRTNIAATPAIQSPVGIQALSGSGPQKIPAAKSMRDVLAVYQASKQEMAVDTLFIKAN
jgi:hypothetical protein